MHLSCHKICLCFKNPQTKCKSAKLCYALKIFSKECRSWFSSNVRKMIHVGGIMDATTVIHTERKKVRNKNLYPVHLLATGVIRIFITKTCLYNFYSLKPLIYIVKLGFIGVYIIFFIFAQKHRLWVLVRTASGRRF